MQCVSSCGFQSVVPRLAAAASPEDTLEVDVLRPPPVSPTEPTRGAGPTLPSEPALRVCEAHCSDPSCPTVSFVEPHPPIGVQPETTRWFLQSVCDAFSRCRPVILRMNVLSTVGPLLRGVKSSDR